MSARPLDGIRVVEAATLAAAPMAATYLAELGAEVIKVEQPGIGDPIRQWGTQREGIGLLWKSVGRNKKSVTLDLRVEQGQEVFRQLAGTADVVIMNARPETLRRWGLDYARLQRVKKELVVLNVTLFGAGGPKSNHPGFGTLAEAMSGFAHMTGETGGPPTLPSFMLADGVASLTATYAILAALYHRDVRGGEGQLVDISILEPLARFFEYALFQLDETGLPPARSGNMSRVAAPRNTYETRDGRWIAMSGSSPSIALRVLEAIERPELLADPKFNTPQGRVENVDELDEIIQGWVASKTLSEAMEAFDRHEVAASPVYDTQQLVEDDHIKSRGTFAPYQDDEVGSVRVQVPVPRLSGTPARIDHLGRALGHDTDSVLGALGLDEARLTELRTAKVI